MPSFKIHRLKETPFQQFRWAPHVTGASQVRPKDYQEAGSVEAPSAYAAWAALQGSDQPLRVGDLLEDPNGSLRICKYVGFEEACWIVPEAKPGNADLPLPPESTQLPGATVPSLEK